MTFGGHDILWSFARQMGKDENCVLWKGQVLSRSEGLLKVRRLSIEGSGVNTEVFKKEKGLRTLLLHYKPEIAVDDMCKAFSHLRILHLSCCNFLSLPDSLCGIVHLRYLDVCGSKIRNLPNSIGELKYLVYLNLANCEDLSHVPCSIIDLQELKLLNTYNSGVKAIPAGLKKLNKLIVLHGFKPYQNNLEVFSSLDELGNLSQLVTLQLVCLERVSDINIAKLADLRSKGRLHNLYLEYKSLIWEDQVSLTNEKKMKSEDVLNELSPPSSLEILKFEGYFGSYLPKWLNLGSTLPNLRFLQISNCACIEGLAPLGQLPNLDYLGIIGVYSIVSAGEEFLWSDIQSKDTIATSSHVKPAFPKLIQLSFERMPNWKEWQWNKGQQAMPKLKELFIEACPKLRSLPEGLLHHATSLEYLEIKGADKLITVENLPSIKDIRVFRCPNMEMISNLPGISYVAINNCPNLKTLENLKSLQIMALNDYQMETLPEYLMTTMPHKLVIWCREELLLKIVSQGETGSEWRKFEHIPTVKIYSLGESFYASYQKTPFSFTTNICTSN